MDYIGEHRLPGQLGHFFIILSLIASLLATFSYALSTVISTGGGSSSKRNQAALKIFRIIFLIGCATVLRVFNLALFDNSFAHAFFNTTSILFVFGGFGFGFSYFLLHATAEDAVKWKKLARYAFLTEVISVVSIFGILFYIIYNHLFEYKYAWQHSSRSLEFKYMLACFWEGQEGSFLLWSIWHCVLGSILIRTSKNWEAPVMTVVSFAQFCIATMIAGLYFFGWKMGSNPFILLRHSGVLDGAPALHINLDTSLALRPDYMSSIKDGNDLNPLLQNYWMVIHPPVLFMGFASTVVPFAFAMAGLWSKKFSEWTRPALPWALFSAAVLGVGITMGAMWAYESLTFGGYWAWDPVENASLVPWLVLISGIHTLLIYRHSGHSLRATHLFFILCFGLILYSTFLTRSGILGESSVHAFTDLGMNWQLLAFLLIFLIPSLIIFFIQYKKIPTIHKEESTSSREFWMFIGSLVFFLSALVIIAKTSLPVLNNILQGLHGIFPSVKIFDRKIAPPEKAEFAYNQIQVFVAIIIAILSAVTQYLKYKQTSAAFFWKKIWLPTVISIIAATLVLAYGNINYRKETVGFMAAIWIAVACSVYAIVANAAYLWAGLRGKLKLSGGSIAHLGFGMVLLGILISSSKKEVLSNNINGIPVLLGPNEDPSENLTLVKGLPVKMGKYTLTYEREVSHPKKPLWFYMIRFKSNDGKEEFVLRPNAFVNYKGNEGLMANPSSKHYWDHDVFTYITSLPNPDAKKDTAAFYPHHIKTGDTVFYSRGYMILQKVSARDNLPPDIFGKGDSLHEASVRIFSKTGSVYTITPTLALVKGNSIGLPDTVTAESLVLQLDKVNADKSIVLDVKESEAVMQYVTLKAYKFPYINLLWLGVLITAIGILISMVRRIRINNLKSDPLQL